MDKTPTGRFSALEFPWFGGHLIKSDNGLGGVDESTAQEARSRIQTGSSEESQAGRPPGPYDFFQGAGASARPGSDREQAARSQKLRLLKATCHSLAYCNGAHGSCNSRRVAVAVAPQTQKNGVPLGAMYSRHASTVIELQSSDSTMVPVFSAE